VSGLAWIWAPLCGCLVAVGILGWLGMHVLRRQVIFVDLALAQIAALGATWAYFLGFDPEGGAGSLLALLSCFAGAALFAVTRSQEGRVPQEAIIGITYVVAAAAAVLLVDLAKDPHGAERIRFLLVGSIVWADWKDVGGAAAVCAGVAAFHFAFRGPLMQASFDPPALAASGRRLPLWDFLFYVSFGIAITAVVRLTGVLLVFSYLIIPGAVATLFADSVRGRLLLAWGVGAFVSFVGLLLGYERPPGPVIVSCFGAVLAVALVLRAVLDAERRLARLLRIAGGLLASAALLGGVPRLLPRPSAEEHGGEREEGRRERDAAAAGPASGLDSPDPLLRQQAVDALIADHGAAATAALAEHLAHEADEELRLRSAVDLKARGRAEGNAELEKLAASANVPFVRLEAAAALGK
jgi:zinc/manganese transport system permease protein